MSFSRTLVGPGCQKKVFFWELFCKGFLLYWEDPLYAVSCWYRVIETEYLRRDPNDTVLCVCKMSASHKWHLNIWKEQNSNINACKENTSWTVVSRINSDRELFISPANCLIFRNFESSFYWKNVRIVPLSLNSATQQLFSFFPSDFSYLWPQSVQYRDRNLTVAIKHWEFNLIASFFFLFSYLTQSLLCKTSFCSLFFTRPRFLKSFGGKHPINIVVLRPYHICMCLPQIILVPLPEAYSCRWDSG